MTAPLFTLLDYASHVLLQHVSAEDAQFMDGVLRELDRKIAEAASAAPAEADYPQAWPMLAQALRRTLGALMLRECDRGLADKWAAVAFALVPLVRADYEALKAARAAREAS